jgi:hypothetical protein
MSPVLTCERRYKKESVRNAIQAFLVHNGVKENKAHVDSFLDALDAASGLKKPPPTKDETSSDSDDDSDEDEKKQEKVTCSEKKAEATREKYTCGFCKFSQTTDYMMHTHGVVCSCKEGPRWCVPCGTNHETLDPNVWCLFCSTHGDSGGSSCTCGNHHGLIPLEHYADCVAAVDETGLVPPPGLVDPVPSNEQTDQDVNVALPRLEDQPLDDW